jgi:peptidoglycan/xylan/chitin deacetylase (PgdA/CDA1 family)
VSTRHAIAATFLLTCLIGMGRAQAADCPGHPNALGVSRTIVLDPSEHPLLGTLQYNESLPLNDHEVVLTFDDGPLPPYTTRVLDTLASECVKATFFLVGRMALGYPPLVLREYNEGHTIAGHSQNHPFTFAKMPVEQAAKEIEDGFASLRTVLGDPRTIAPFFRIPGLLRQDSVENYLASRHYATWSLDFLADDWTHISAKEIVRRALQRIEARRRGILLLHDIQPATALALPTILAELKARGYKIVHVVPATPDRPATVAQSEDWVQRHPLKPSWPRVLATGPSTPSPGLEVPSAANFGIADSTGDGMPIDRIAGAPRGNAAADRSLLQHEPWPNVRFTAPADADLLPVPDAQDFIYYSNKSRISLGAMTDRKTVRQKLVATPKLALKPAPAKPPGPPKEPGSAPTRTTKPIGHQLSVSKPAASLADLLRLGQR